MIQLPEQTKLSYVNGIARKQVQGANAIVDAMSAAIMKQHNPGLTEGRLFQRTGGQPAVKKLSAEEKKWLKKIAEKSDLLKNPNPQRGRK